jgi:hypothetical protein
MSWKLRGSEERLSAQAPDFECHLPWRLHQSWKLAMTKIVMGIVMSESRYDGFSMGELPPGFNS